MFRARCYAACLGLVVCLLGSVARAERAQLALSYSAPESCPESAQVHRDVERLLGEGTPTSSAVVSADARIEGEPGAYRLTLSWSSYASGDVRSLEAPSCEELTQALALMVALAVDPETRAPQSVPGTESETAPARPSEPPPRPATAPSPSAESPLSDTGDGAPPAARFVGPELGAKGGFRFEGGTLPDVGVGGFIGIDVPLGTFSLGIVAEALLPQEEFVADRGGKFWMFGLAAEPCRPFAVSRVVLSPCLLAELVLTPSSGRGVTVPEEASTWFARFGAGVEAAMPANGRFRFLLGAGVLVAALRPSFRLADASLVHRPDWFAWRTSLGVAVVF